MNAYCIQMIMYQLLTPSFFLYQLRVNGIVSVNVTALLLTMTQKHSMVTRVGMGRTCETVRFQSEYVVPFPH